MSKIIGITVGTPLSPKRIKEELKPVTSVNGNLPDESGNVALPSYNGEYAVVPTVDEDITLLTAQTFVDANIKVKKIPITAVANQSGGKTIIIGG